MAYPDPPPEDFGKRLKRLAKERGLSNIDLAEKTGAHIVTVSRWMGGQAPKGESLVILADVLDVPPKYLLPPKPKQKRGKEAPPLDMAKGAVKPPRPRRPLRKRKES